MKLKDSFSVQGQTGTPPPPLVSDTRDSVQLNAWLTTGREPRPGGHLFISNLSVHCCANIPESMLHKLVHGVLGEKKTCHKPKETYLGEHRHTQRLTQVM